MSHKPPLTTIDIARAYANAFAADRNLIAWAEEHFGRAFAIQIGEDMRRPPDDKACPWLVIIPLSMHSGPQAAANVHELVVVAGIEDEEFSSVGQYTEMRGLERLSCELVPLLERRMSDALDRARLQEMAVEYEIAAYPLLLEAIIGVTVTESRPIGLRR